VGALSLTDRVFPLVFPDTDLRLFRDAVAQTVGIEEPPPRLVGSRSATDFRSLIDLALGPYFRPPVRRQAIVVFSDAETETPAASLAESFAQRHIRVYVVRFWHRNERVWTHRRPERYRPDASALPSVKRFVTATHGKLFSEHDEAAVASELRKLTRGGKRIPIGATHDRRPLAPYLIGLAVLPLAAWTRRRSR
jgi:hypothetical protein